MAQLPSNTLALILDMDGVLWRDSDPIGDLAVIFGHLNSAGIRVALVTNNSTRTADQYLDKLQGFGVRLHPWQVITSSQTLAHVLGARFPKGARIYILGEEGLADAL